MHSSSNVNNCAQGIVFLITNLCLCSCVMSALLSIKAFPQRCQDLGFLSSGNRGDLPDPVHLLHRQRRTEPQLHRHDRSGPQLLPLCDSEARRGPREGRGAGSGAGLRPGVPEVPQERQAGERRRLETHPYHRIFGDENQE